MRALVLFSILALLAPLAASSGSFEHRGVLEGRFGVVVGAPTTGIAHLYDVMLAPGDTLRAVLTWTEPSADLDLELSAPAPGCALLPAPDAACLAKRVPFVGGGIGCPGAYSSTIALGPAAEAIEFVATDGGKHSLAVIAGLAAPSTPPGYRLVVQVEGAGGAVSGPTDAEYVFRSPECRAL